MATSVASPEIPKSQQWLEVEMPGELPGETLKCKIPFILAKGEYKQPDLERIGKEEGEWLRDWLIEVGLVRKGYSPEKLLEFAKDVARLAGYFAPRLEVGTNEFKAHSLMVVTGFLVDDIVEDRHFFGKIRDDDPWSAIPAGDIIRGKYKTEAELPTKHPLMIPILKGFFRTFEFQRKTNPRFADPAVHEPFAVSYDECLLGMIFLNLEDTYPRDRISPINQTLYQYFRVFDNGTEPTIDSAYIMYDVVPTHTQRTNMLYRRLMANSSTIVGHTNDIVGLQRDIRDGIGYNLVIHKSRYMSLQQAFAETAEIVRECVAEFMLLRQRMLYLYGKDDSWVQIIRIITEFTDGHLWWCSQVKRYGSPTIRILDEETLHELTKQPTFIQKQELITKEYNKSDFYGSATVEV